MKHKLKSFALALAVTLAMALPVLAADKGSVVVELKGQKVVKGPDGKEKFEGVDKAKPGEIIEYSAVYRNKGKNVATDVKATIPVPLGTEYVPGSANPAQITASLNGKTYSGVPLMHKVKLPSGKEEMREVPYEEYRFIRWPLNSLKTGQSKTVSMRVKISTTPAPAIK